MEKSSYKNIQKEDLYLLEHVLKHLKDKYNLKDSDIASLIKKENTIPTYIFANSLSPLESIVKYLKENLKLTNIQISSLLKRKQNTISLTYKKAKQKLSTDFIVKESLDVPLSIFQNRKFSILESLVKYLKQISGLSNHKIALLLDKDDRTIWTIYSRVKKKNAT